MAEVEKEKDLPGVTDDDNPDEVEVDEDRLDSDTDLDDLLGLVSEDDDEEDEDDEPPAAKAEETAVTPEPDPERKFTQADIDRILAERLGRDRKTQAIRELESLTGLSVDQLLAQQRQAKVEEAAYQHNLSPEEAAKYVERQEEYAQLKAEREDFKRQQEHIVKTTAYERAKTQFLSDEKANKTIRSLSQKYAKEIDAFSQGGLVVDFDTARDYVLGTKMHEVLAERETAVEQKVLANVNKRSKAAPEKERASQGVSLNKDELRVAKMLGVAPSDYAAGKKR